MNEQYRETVRLLLTVVPTVFRVPNFAMKGGTAINFFVRDMPRLSVDIDVTFARLDVSREVALAQIADGLTTIAAALKRQGLGAQLAGPTSAPESKLFVIGSRARITVEVNTILRGTVLPVETRELLPVAQQQFALQVSAPILAPAELYGGKLVALLDRQHPRDLFDGLLLLEEGGITPAIVQCFVIYLASHNRPTHELLHPNVKDIARVFEHDFLGMTQRDVSVAELVSARDQIVKELLAKLTSHQRHFLMSLMRGDPDWSASGVLHAERLPALQWKLDNLRKLSRANSRKHTALVLDLEKVLG